MLMCVMLVMSFAVLSVPTAAEESAGEVLTVGVPVDRCPLFYPNPDTGEITGIGVDLMRIAAEEAGYTAVFRAIGETTLKEALDNDAYDVIMPFGSAITSASGQPTVVTDNLMQTPFTLVTKGERELPPLNRLRVGMLRSQGGVIETLQGLYHGLEIRGYETMADCVKALRTGEVDALLHNSYIWSYVLQKPAYEDLKVQPATILSMDFRAGTVDTPEGRATVERLNKGLTGLTDAKRQAVILDYTSRKLYRYDFSDYLHQYWLIALLGVLLIAAIITIVVQRGRYLRRRHEEKLQQMMDYDMLTGLLSMSGFRKRVEELLRAHPDCPYFLSYNNIRDFKFINDSLGREAGDALLKFWAEKSMENISEQEAMARVEEDHFAVLRLIEGDERMESDKTNVFLPVQNYFVEQGMKNRVQISSGIYVLTPEDFRVIDVDHMLDLARVAEKRARDGRKPYTFYNPEQWERGKQIADLINYLPGALQTEDVYVWYQPQVNEAGRIIGAEALARWDHTKLGWLYPLDFIGTLEKSGLIYDLDSYVWERVCRDLHRWNREGHHRSVSVNISRDDFREDTDIPGRFRELIEKYDLTPDQIRIEITETAYAENAALLIQTTEKLRELGFQVEMDDFGSGYSSLHMLKEVPVDRIKLDLHFLTESGDPEKCRTIIACVIDMVRQLGMKMIAEGVETEEQADFLRSRGCTEMQGFYFYRPMTVQDFEKACADH